MKQFEKRMPVFREISYSQTRSPSLQTSHFSAGMLLGYVKMSSLLCVLQPTSFLFSHSDFKYQRKIAD